MPVNKQAAEEVIEGAKAYQIADTWPPPQTESQELAPQETPPLTHPRGHPEFDPSLDGILSGSRTRIAGWLAGGLGLVGSGLAWLNDNTGLLLGVLILAVITGALLNSFALAKIAKLIRKQTTILKGGKQ